MTAKQVRTAAYVVTKILASHNPFHLASIFVYLVASFHHAAQNFGRGRQHIRSHAGYLSQELAP
jgi:hypothetical protein